MLLSQQATQTRVNMLQSRKKLLKQPQVHLKREWTWIIHPNNL